MKRLTRYIGLVLILILATLLLCTSCSKPSGIRALVFPQMTEEIPVDFSALSYEVSDAVMMTLESMTATQLPVYSIERKIYTTEQMVHMSELFGIDSASCKKTSTSLYRSYQQDGKTAYFYTNGTFRYSGPMDESSALRLSEEDVVQQAETFLRKNDLFPDEFSYFGTGDCSVKSVYFDEKKGEIVEEETVYGKTVTFRRTVDRYPVVGNAHVYVTITNAGIGEVSIAYSNHGEAQMVDIISPREAVQKLRQKDTNMQLECNVEVQDVRSAKINRVELVYVEHAYDNTQTHLQPCYRIVGSLTDGQTTTEDFSALIPAIPEELTSE